MALYLGTKFISGNVDPSISLLEKAYPVGSIYIGLQESCPFSGIFGTWEPFGEGKTLMGCRLDETTGRDIEAGLPEIDGDFSTTDYGSVENPRGSFFRVYNKAKITWGDECHPIGYNTNHNYTKPFYDEQGNVIHYDDVDYTVDDTPGGYDIVGFDKTNGFHDYLVRFQASKSSSIYGNSNTVQPPAVTVHMWKRTA